ncbi:MAG: RNA polymerase factor sigma-54 [Eubacterium sp.]|nr:RNA polymerase factor sigma-54 [Eubacterium sp.]
MDIQMTLSQKQILTQQMLQTMQILQMSAQELESYVNEMALENPTIDIVEKRHTDDLAFERQADLERKLNWLETTDRQNSVYYRDDGDSDSREANLMDIRDQGESLEEYLKAQLIHRHFTSRQENILRYLVAALNQDGYFEDDPARAAEYLEVPEAEILQMLAELQKLDPAGIGARSLEECLLLQIEREEITPDQKRDTEEIVRSYLPLIAKNHLHVIAKKMKISAERVDFCCDLIRSLNPKPGNAFNDREHFHYISPEVVVVKFGDHFDVLVNEQQYPSFQINAYYQELAETTKDRDTRAYLREKLKQTQELQDSIRYRVSTLSGVAHLLVEKQLDFFRYGPGHKRPMQLADFAEELDLHPSTISRTMSSKYLQCSWGIYPLNYFLTAEVHATTTGEATTREHIIAQMQEIVDVEDKKKPLSDQAIAEALKARGIEISRRTVSKYRGISGIPDKSGRKEL